MPGGKGHSITREDWRESTGWTGRWCVRAHTLRLCNSSPARAARIGRRGKSFSLGCDPTCPQRERVRPGDLRWLALRVSVGGVLAGASGLYGGGRTKKACPGVSPSRPRTRKVQPARLVADNASADSIVLVWPHGSRGIDGRGRQLLDGSGFLGRHDGGAIATGGRTATGVAAVGLTAA